MTVVLESEEGGSVELLLTYQVFGASWRPTYDIRVNTDEENKEMQVGCLFSPYFSHALSLSLSLTCSKSILFQIAYYGGVQQTTGETWDGLVFEVEREERGRERERREERRGRE